RDGRPEPVHPRSARAFGERPFVWITWWMKSWTSPLPGRPARSYHGRPPAASRPNRSVVGSSNPRAVPTGDRLAGPRRRRLPRATGRGNHRVVPDHGRALKGGRPSMDSRSAATGTPDPDAIEFVRFCYRRRRVGWPELYDEMCAVAGRGLFRGYGPDELAGHGIKFGLFEMPHLAVTVAEIVAEDRARLKGAAEAHVSRRSPAIA